MKCLPRMNIYGITSLVWLRDGFIKNIWCKSMKRNQTKFNNIQLITKGSRQSFQVTARGKSSQMAEVLMTWLTLILIKNLIIAEVETSQNMMQSTLHNNPAARWFNIETNVSQVPIWNMKIQSHITLFTLFLFFKYVTWLSHWSL